MVFEEGVAAVDVSIIIVNYNTKKILADCLNSIYAQTNGIDFEVIVSDNGSADGSIDMLKSSFPQVILIENNANLGFGAANNRGLAVAKGKYIFYLNSDTILLNNAVKIFFDYFEANGTKEKIGALGCNLLDADRNFLFSSGDFPDFDKILADALRAVYGLWKICIKKMLGQKMPEIKKNSLRMQKKFGSVDFVSGAAFFLRNDKFAKFDENIFLYTEEVDLQFQMKKSGLGRILIEGPEIIHLEGQSSKESDVVSDFYTMTSFHSICNNISRVYYCRKNHSKLKAFVLKILIFLQWTNPLLIKTNYKFIPALLKR